MRGENDDLILTVGNMKYKTRERLNAPSLVRYFQLVFKSKTGSEYKISGSQSRIHQSMQLSVIDYCDSRGLGIAGMKEFVDWVFATRPSEIWALHFLPNL